MRGSYGAAPATKDTMDHCIGWKGWGCLTDKKGSAGRQQGSGRGVQKTGAGEKKGTEVVKGHQAVGQLFEQ